MVARSLARSSPKTPGEIFGNDSPGKPTVSEERQRIEDALVQSILDAGGEDMREEIAAAGGDPDALVARVDAAIAAARGSAGRARLERARAELSAWQSKSGPASAPEREAARKRFERLRSGKADPDTKMMMAARKGEGLSDSDLEGLIEDMAELERLERDKDDG
jgi:hypothetical protein